MAVGFSGFQIFALSIRQMESLLVMSEQASELLLQLISAQAETNYVQHFFIKVNNAMCHLAKFLTTTA